MTVDFNWLLVNLKSLISPQKIGNLISIHLSEFKWMLHKFPTYKSQKKERLYSSLAIYYVILSAHPV